MVDLSLDTGRLDSRSPTERDMLFSTTTARLLENPPGFNRLIGFGYGSSTTLSSVMPDRGDPDEDASHENYF